LLFGGEIWSTVGDLDVGSVLAVLASWYFDKLSRIIELWIFYWLLFWMDICWTFWGWIWPLDTSTSL